MWILTTILMLLAGNGQSGDYIQDLRDKDPEIRELAAKICGAQGIKTAVPDLIELLEDQKEEVRTAAYASLKRLTGKASFGQDIAVWREWWEKEGEDIYPATNLTRQQIVEILEPRVRNLQLELDKDVKKAKSEIRMLSFFVAIIGLLFVGIMFYFVGHISSRLKEWKDFIRQAEGYIARGEEINKRTDKVIEEVNEKKTEILEFAKKQREEVQAEIDRYADLLQENSEHQMREEVMGLRQKAEKELEQTLGELGKQVETQVRRSAKSSRDMLEGDYESLREKFVKEVEHHSIFLEGRLYSINGKPEEALRKYKRLVSLKPDHYLGWTHLGDTYRELLRYDESLEAYEKASMMAPNDSAILYNVAATYALLKQKEKMLETLSRAIANDGEFKDEALNDAAFRDYWNDPAFKDMAEG